MADARETRQRILDIALELFAERGFAGTSVADIAGRLGTSKAALYYHFRSKAEIAEALIAGPLKAYGLLVESAPGRDPEDLLGAVIDTTASLYTLADVIGNDPSVRAALRDHVLPRSREINDALIGALGGSPQAHAAYSVAKNGTLSLLADSGGQLDPATRGALLAAALRALRG
jgi:AcrR family transcriptional regulator